MEIVIIAAVFWVITGALSGMVASSKGHSGGSWFVAGVLLGPLALLATVGLGDRRKEGEVEDEEEEQGGHEHDWIETELSDPISGKAVSALRCADCGLLKRGELESEPEPEHEHVWVDEEDAARDTLTGAAMFGQRCRECGETRRV